MAHVREYGYFLRLPNLYQGIEGFLIHVAPS